MKHRKETHKDAHGIGDQEYGKPKKKAFRNGKPRYPELRLEQGNEIHSLKKPFASLCSRSERGLNEPSQPDIIAAGCLSR
jgi:hypothetical protein